MNMVSRILATLIYQKEKSKTIPQKGDKPILLQYKYKSKGHFSAA